MIYKYIEPSGREVSLEGDEVLRRAIRDGRVRTETPMYHASSGRWMPAHKHPDYQRLLAQNQEEAAERKAARDRNQGKGPPETGPATGTGAGRGMRRDTLMGLQGAALGGVILVAWYLAPSNVHMAEQIGNVVGAVALFGFLAGIFLVWSKRTRPFIPFTMLGLILISAWGEYTNAPRGGSVTSSHFDQLGDLIDQVESEFGLRNMIEADGSAPRTPTGPATPTSPPAGSSSEDRAIWAAGQALTLFTDLMAEYDDRYELGMEHLEGWFEPDYFANASNYPHVPAYLSRNRAAVEDMARNMEPEAMRRLDGILARANLPRANRDAFRRSFRQGLEDNSLEKSGVADIQRGMINLSEELHAILIQNEHLITENPATGEVDFQNAALEGRVWGLVNDITQQFEALVQKQEEIMENTRRVFADSRSRLVP